MAIRPKSVANWTPKMPTVKYVDHPMLKPNAKDNPDTWNTTNGLGRTLGKGGRASGPLGKAGREF